mmetsp:Transcript_17586/g.26300  ORF Transcript_17586/g.26300 Transcript_17586/m.26300 type:complete len:98 (-) Transcript_17586:251-544(-)
MRIQDASKCVPKFIVLEANEIGMRVTVKVIPRRKILLQACSFDSRGKDHTKDNSWDDEIEDSKPTSKVSDKKHSLSFDSNCSYLPDDDFATANWDSD